MRHPALSQSLNLLRESIIELEIRTPELPRRDGQQVASPLKNSRWKFQRPAAMTLLLFVPLPGFADHAIDGGRTAEGEQAIPGLNRRIPWRRHQPLAVPAANAHDHHPRLAQVGFHQLLADVRAVGGNLYV